jgi:hypothetical protein
MTFFSRTQKTITPPVDIVERRVPHHVAVVLGEGAGGAPQADEVDRLYVSGDFMRLFSVVGAQNVRYLSFCCPSCFGDLSQNMACSEFERLFHFLKFDQDAVFEPAIADEREFQQHPNLASFDVVESDGKTLSVFLRTSVDGRVDIVDSVKALMEKVECQELSRSELSADRISQAVASFGLPDPDLMVFTGGVRRLENSLLWQSAYAELAFVDVPWWQLTDEIMLQLLEDYAGRERRFGGLNTTTSQQAV